MTHRTRRLLALALAVSTCLFLTACGAKPAAEEGPEDLDPIPSQITAEDPLGGFLNLSNLSGSTIAAHTRDLDLTSTIDGVTVTLTRVLGDGMSLCIAYRVELPEAVDLNEPGLYESPETQRGLVYFTVEGFDTGGPDGVGSTMQQADDKTLQGVAVLTQREPAQKEELAVTIHVLVPSATEHVFSVPVPATETRTADLIDASGAKAGTVVLSPFALKIQLDTPVEDPDELARLSAGTLLLDGEGNILDTGLSIGGDEGCLVGTFYVPVEPDAVFSLTMEDGGDVVYSAEFA